MIIYKQDSLKHTFFLFFAWKGSVYRSIYVDIILFTGWCGQSGLSTYCASLMGAAPPGAPS